MYEYLFFQWHHKSREITNWYEWVSINAATLHDKKTNSTGARKRTNDECRSCLIAFRTHQKFILNKEILDVPENWILLTENNKSANYRHSAANVIKMQKLFVVYAMFMGLKGMHIMYDDNKFEIHEIMFLHHVVFSFFIMIMHDVTRYKLWVKFTESFRM